MFREWPRGKTETGGKVEIITVPNNFQVSSNILSKRVKRGFPSVMYYEFESGGLGWVGRLIVFFLN